MTAEHAFDLPEAFAAFLRDYAERVNSHAYELLCEVLDEHSLYVEGVNEFSFGELCRDEGPKGAVGDNWCHLPAGHKGHHGSPTAEWGTFA